jgi:hypothetical protein
MELPRLNPDNLLGDKVYDSDDVRSDLADRGIEAVIHRNRTARLRSNIIDVDDVLQSSVALASGYLDLAL